MENIYISLQGINVDKRELLGDLLRWEKQPRSRKTKISQDSDLVRKIQQSNDIGGGCW